MINKYNDYPYGISEDHITKANISQLARITEILTSEFIHHTEKVYHSNEDNRLIFQKFRFFSSAFVSILKEYDAKGDLNEEKRLHASILMGSILEATIQFFLLCYNEDFLKSNWRIWHEGKDGNPFEYDYDLIKSHMVTSLNSMIENNIIGDKQKKDLVDAIEAELKMRKNGRKIEKMMLDELIRFSEKEGLFDVRLPDENGEIQDDDEASGKCLIKKMDKIREGRNNVHIFATSDIPSTNLTLENSKVLCSILNDLLSRIRFLESDEQGELLYETVLAIPGTTLVNIDEENHTFSVYPNLNDINELADNS